MRLVLAAAAAAALAAPAAAQVAVEVRGGAGVGNYAAAASDLQLDPRPSFGASVSYAPSRRLAVYAGYSRTAFGCETGFCTDRGMTFTSSGVEAGVRLSLPVVAGPWVRAGLVSHSLDYESAPAQGAPGGGGEAGGVGFELGAGVELGLGRVLAITPGMRYVRYGAADDDGVAMLVGDVGLRIRI